MENKKKFLKIIENQLESLVVEHFYNEDTGKYVNVVQDERDLEEAVRLQKISAIFRLPSKKPNRKKYRRKK